MLPRALCPVGRPPGWPGSLDSSSMLSRNFLWKAGVIMYQSAWP